MATTRKTKPPAGGRKGAKAGDALRAAVIRTRVDPSLREKADAVLDRLGVSTPEAIRMFLQQVVLQRGIPFDVRLTDTAEADDAPEAAWNGETEAAFRKALDDIDEKFGSALQNLAK